MLLGNTDEKVKYDSYSIKESLRKEGKNESITNENRSLEMLKGNTIVNPLCVNSVVISC